MYLFLQARHAARNKNDLMKLLLKYPEGIYTVELKDAYKGVADDLKVGPVGSVRASVRLQFVIVFLLHLFVRT